jgi:phenylalanine-4-hydroxylase
MSSTMSSGMCPCWPILFSRNYVLAFGKGGPKAAKMGATDKLARLYWYTVEFGLIRQPEACAFMAPHPLLAQGIRLCR